MSRAPQPPPPSSAATHEELRRHPRTVVDVPAAFVRAGSKSGEETDIVLIDMGPGGVLIAPRTADPTDGLPPIGARSTLTFKVMGNRLCEATGRVVRHQERGFAIAFQELNKAMDSFLRHLARLPAALRPLYLIDMYHPQLSLDKPA